MVISTINWYKKYRSILNSDIVHLRRADGRDWDGILHVNPILKEKGLMMVYNPTPLPMKRTLQVPVYYTGLATTARIREQEGPAKSYTISRDYKVELPVTIPAGSYSWFVIE